MGKATKIFLACAALTAISVTALLVKFPAIRLNIAKRDAHQVLEAPSGQAMNVTLPDNLRNLNAIPSQISLPNADSMGEPKDTEATNSYVLRFPRPLSLERRGTDSSLIRLTFTKYVVDLRPPFSQATYDAAFLRLNSQTYFEHILQAYRTRPADIDSAPNLDSLNMTITLLQEKKSRLWRYVYWAVFDDDARCGFLEACDEDATQIHFTITFKRTSASIGGFVKGKSSLSQAEVERFVGLFELEPRSQFTSP